MPNFEEIEAFIEHRSDICRVGRGSSDALVQRSEQILGLQFPDEYREFLKRWGTLRMGYFQIYGIAGANLESPAVPNGIWLTQRKRDHVGLPVSLIVLCDNEGDQLWCLETARSKLSIVVTWDVHLRRISGTRANTFIEFLLSLARQIDSALPARN